jgi:serine O-acetyltransferase
VFSRLREDIRTVFDKDPAARSVLEVLLCYPGLKAVWFHRVAHWLWKHHMPLTARAISQFARFLTGIEIHPGATIGRRFFIDHGMGVVIGETAEIGDDVLMYQGVVLGGTSLERKKRHPTLRNNVVVGAGAILLGPITVGEGARIGAGSVVIQDVEPGTTVVGVPAHSVEERRRRAALDHGNLPDPVLDLIHSLAEEHEKLKQRMKEIEKEKAQ